MYALVENGQITKYFSYPKGFTLNDNQYPAAVFTKWTQSEREAIGLYKVVTDDTNYKDRIYYITTTEQYQTLCTETDEDNDDNNLRLGSSFSSRRSEILNDINDLRALANEATSEAEQGACKKGVEKKVNDLINLNQEEEIKGWIGL